MKQLSSVTTGVVSQAKKASSSTGSPHGEITSAANQNSAKSKAPALTDLPQSVTSLTKSLTSLSLKHSRDSSGKNFTQRIHQLAIPIDQAKQHYLTLMALNSPGTASQVTELLKRMFAMYPATQKKELSVAQDWLRILGAQPLGAVWLAYEHFIRTEREFAPSAGVFLAKTDEQAKRIRIRLASLKEAIENEKGTGA